MGTGRAAPVAQVGDARSVLSAEVVRLFVHGQLAGLDVDGRRVCVLVPDATRTCPLPLLVSAVHDALRDRARAVTVLVALGTHAPLDDAGLAALVGDDPNRPGDRYPGLTVRNHEWWEPSTFARVGTIGADRLAELSSGRLRQALEVRINRAVLDHDVCLILGPVFPHEVVGFSGGNKYLFPGVSGQEVIDVSHWLGALITSAEIIGVPGTTPVRALIDEAAALVPGERHALCVVTRSGGHDAGDGRAGAGQPDPSAAHAGAGVALHAATFGEPRVAWAAAAEVSARAHVRRLDAPVRRVLSLVPERYDDLWTGAKGFYKVEPVVADGGQVVLYAPHIREISAVHPGLAEIGYHCRDFLLAHWDEVRHHPWGELAHSTHLRGAGTYDEVHGERPRVTVTLATSIPEAQVRAVGLDHLDWRSIDLDAWRADPDALVVPDAGEVLFRLRDGASDGVGAVGAP